MKRLSALVLIVAVLNPLCCCLSAAEGAGQPIPAQDHACCPGETEQNQSNHQNPADCPHKMLADNDAFIAPDTNLQAAPFVAHSEQMFEVFDVGSQYASQSATAIRPSIAAYIVPWIRTQTDCVRLL